MESFDWREKHKERVEYLLSDDEIHPERYQATPKCYLCGGAPEEEHCEHCGHGICVPCREEDGIKTEEGDIFCSFACFIEWYDNKYPKKSKAVSEAPYTNNM